MLSINRWTLVLSPAMGTTPSGQQKSRYPAPIGFILRTKAAN